MVDEKLHHQIHLSQKHYNFGISFVHSVLCIVVYVDWNRMHSLYSY